MNCLPLTMQCKQHFKTPELALRESQARSLNTDTRDQYYKTIFAVIEMQ